MNIVIKDLKITGNDDLATIYTKTVMDAFPEYTESVRKFFSSGDYLRRMMESYFRFGAFDGDKLVGYVLAQKPFGGVVFVVWIAILPEFQGRGIGKSLMQKIEEVVKPFGVHNLQLNADAKNLSFYEKLGYEKIGFDKKGYFGADSYILKKVLQEPDESAFF